MTMIARLFFALCLQPLICFVCPKEVFNPYEVLGLHPTATKREIVLAYKNASQGENLDHLKALDLDEGVKQMKQISVSFEILSSHDYREEYDKKGTSRLFKDTENDDGKKEGGAVWRKKSFFNQNYRRMTSQIQKERPEIKQAQARLVHVTTLDQLEALVLNDDGVFEKNVLICFARRGEARRVAEDAILFPHPYAGSFSSFGVWWEDLIQSVQVDFTAPNEITEIFGVDETLAGTSDPVFAFMRRGSHFFDEVKHYHTNSQTEFEDWVLKSLKDIRVTINFVNEHDHDVELIYIEGSYHKMMGTIPSGHEHLQHSYLFHEFAARDARVDTFPESPNRNKMTIESCLDSWLLDMDKSPIRLVIEQTNCYDLSGYCGRYYRKGYCDESHGNYTVFHMDEACRQTCGLCSRADPVAPAEPEL